MSTTVASEPSALERRTAKVEAQEWARQILVSENVIVCDTETDALVYDDPNTNCVQFSAATLTGKPILNTILRPGRDLGHNKAWEVHGIGAEDWACAPTFAQVAPIIAQLFDGRQVVYFNAAFDAEVLKAEFSRTGVAYPDYHEHCAMLWYARYQGKWNRKFGDWKWPRLPMLAQSGQAHDSMTDVLSTIEVIERMAGVCQASEIDLSF